MEDKIFNERIKETFFVVEANCFEQFTLWRNFAHNSPNRINDHNSVNWEQLNDGCSEVIGYLDNRPVNLSLHWVRIEGKLILFYYMCSQVTDSVMADKWVDKHFLERKWDNNSRGVTTDANNFHNCLQAIRESKGE